MALKLRSGLSRASLVGGMTAVMAFLYLPIVILVLFSFNAGARLSFPLQGLSLRWYEHVLSDPVFTTAIENSLIVGTIAAATTAVLGTLAAFGLSLASPRLRGVLGLLFFAPITLPGLFLGLSMLTFFAEVNVQLSLWTVAAAHFVYTFPYFLMIGRAALERMDPGLDEIAADLGAAARQRFFKVTLPLVWPVLAAAAVLAFALSFDEFIITFFVIGPQSTTPLVIWSGMRRAADPSINALATLLLLVTLVGTVGMVALVSLRRHARRAVLTP